MCLRAFGAIAGDQHSVFDRMGIRRHWESHGGLSGLVSRQVWQDVLRYDSGIEGDVLDAGDRRVDWLWTRDCGAGAVGVLTRAALAGEDVGVEFVCIPDDEFWTVVNERFQRHVSALLLFQRDSRDVVFYAVVERESASCKGFMMPKGARIICRGLK